MGDDLDVGGLFIPIYDHVRYYTNERLTKWDELDKKEPVMILLEKTVDAVSLRTIVPVGRVFVENKIRYVYLDDLKLIK